MQWFLHGRWASILKLATPIFFNIPSHTTLKHNMYRILVRNCPYSKDNHIPDQNSRKKSSLYPYPKAMHLQVVELLRCNLFAEMLLTQNSILIWVTYALWLVSPNTYETSFVFFRNKQLFILSNNFQTQLLILIRMLVVLQNLLPRLDFCYTWTRVSFCKKNVQD